jgi:hypothetical protein
MTEISMDIFDEAIELTKESVEAQLDKIEADLPGEETLAAVSEEPDTAEPIAIVTTIEPPAQQPSESDTTTTTSPVNESEYTPEAQAELQRLRAEAQSEYEQRLDESKEAHAQASIRVMEIAKDLKEAKREQKEALEEFFNLQLSGPQLPTSLPLAGSKKKKKGDQSSDIKPLGDDLERLIESDLTWRDIPIAEVLSGIPGLGTKKYDAIVSSFSNLGQLEDARGQASREFKEFREVMPEGIGPSLTDKLQERIFDLMKSHFAKVREKIAVANEGKATTSETAAVPKPEDAPKADARKPEKAGVTVSVDDALLDDSDLI